jgi:hypothetical protein
VKKMAFSQSLSSCHFGKRSSRTPSSPSLFKFMSSVELETNLGDTSLL